MTRRRGGRPDGGAASDSAPVGPARAPADSARPPAGTLSPPRPPPDWWRPERVRHEIPAGLGPLVDHLEDRLFARPEPARERVGTPEAPDPPSDTNVENTVAAAAILRAEIQRGAERGAPPELVSELHARLDHELGEVAGALLKKLGDESRRLLRDVSHDIRSPLNSILFLADALISEHSGGLNDVQRRQVGVLYTAAVSLVGLVNDLIDAARLGDGSEIPVASERFSMEAVLNEVEHLVGPLANHREVRLGFRLETLGPRTGDRRLLTRVLLNLTTNALQACEAGDRVEVRVTEPEAGSLRLVVWDDGPGTDAAGLAALIGGDRAPSRDADGQAAWTHGLGLSICARLVRAAGGRIEVESAPGVGSSFTVELPFRRS